MAPRSGLTRRVILAWLAKVIANRETAESGFARAVFVIRDQKVAVENEHRISVCLMSDRSMLMTRWSARSLADHTQS